MAHLHAIAGLALAGALSLASPTSAFGQAGKAPKSLALCLPPGSLSPVACGTARAGQTIRLQVAKTSLPRGPISLRFLEERSDGRAPRSAGVTIPPTISRDGGYDVPLPQSLCANSQDRLGNFEIQRLMSSYNQAETLAESLGMLTIAC
ncbi:MAG TPA: hypothetical protein VM326_07095 [Sphingomicrobium sp.]|jgi:hypothetical protein|nr:hypothetical protein [Sphingomicrobium sp.]